MFNLLSTLASIVFSLVAVLAITCMLLDVCCALPKIRRLINAHFHHPR